jgi:hypothetical protein
MILWSRMNTRVMSHFSRMKTLGLDVLRGADQKPFGGQVDYDVWLTIDSDIVFTPEQIVELLRRY